MRSEADRLRQCIAEVAKLMTSNVACKPADIEREIWPRYPDLWKRRSFSARLMREARKVMRRRL